MAVGGGGHADNGPVEGPGRQRPVGAGVAEAENAAVRGHQPVPMAVGGGGHADNGPVEGPAPSDP